MANGSFSNTQREAPFVDPVSSLVKDGTCEIEAVCLLYTHMELRGAVQESLRPILVGAPPWFPG